MNTFKNSWSVVNWGKARLVFPFRARNHDQSEPQFHVESESNFEPSWSKKNFEPCTTQVTSIETSRAVRTPGCKIDWASFKSNFVDRKPKFIIDFTDQSELEHEVKEMNFQKKIN